MKLSHFLNAIAASRTTAALFVAASVLMVIGAMGLAQMVDAEYAFGKARHARLAAEREVGALRGEKALLSLLDSHAALLDSLTERLRAPVSKAEQARYLQTTAQSSGVRFHRLEQRERNDAGQEVTTIEVSGGYANTKKWLRNLSLAPVIWAVKEIRIIRENEASPEITLQVKLLSYAR